MRLSRALGLSVRDLGEADSPRKRAPIPAGLAAYAAEAGLSPGDLELLEDLASYADPDATAEDWRFADEALRRSLLRRLTGRGPAPSR